MLIRRADMMQKRPTNFKVFGFDFTVEEIDKEIMRDDALVQARRTIVSNYPV
jgi:hypothetical protein